MCVFVPDGTPATVSVVYAAGRVLLYAVDARFIYPFQHVCAVTWFCGNRHMHESARLNGNMLWRLHD